MDKPSVGIGIKGLLHGFAALYGLAMGGFLLVFAMSFMLSGVLQWVVMGLGLIGFVAFSGLAVILKMRKPDIFVVREEHLLTIRTEGSKIPKGKIITEITELDKPRHYPQINNNQEEMGEQ